MTGKKQIAAAGAGNSNDRLSIIVEDISKNFGRAKAPALDHISFTVKKGERFGLIGPDGAGKTTLFRILATLLLADEGKAIVNGHDVKSGYSAIRRQIGYMPGKFSLYQDLTVEENLLFFASLFGTTVKANYALIGSIYEQLKPFKDRRAGKLSGGMKQKLALCCALIHKPEVLLLDEPTTGVDVVSRREFWEMLVQLKEQGITILVSTPYMDEAVLCERVALIQTGTILRIDSPGSIMKTFPVPLYAVKGENMYRLLQDLRTQPGIETCYAFGEWLHVTLRHQENGASALRTIASGAGHHDLQMERIAPTIEDSFIRLSHNSGHQQHTVKTIS